VGYYIIQQHSKFQVLTALEDMQVVILIHFHEVNVMAYAIYIQSSFKDPHSNVNADWKIQSSGIAVILLVQDSQIIPAKTIFPSKVPLTKLSITYPGIKNQLFLSQRLRHWHDNLYYVISEARESETLDFLLDQSYVKMSLVPLLPHSQSPQGKCACVPSSSCPSPCYSSLSSSASIYAI
jgi:hypothetical protein